MVFVEYQWYDKLFAIFLGIFGFIGNTIVISVYINKRHRNTTDFFILSLAINDLIGSIAITPMEVRQMLTQYQGILNSPYECSFYFFSFYSVFVMSILVLTEIAIDRWLSICHPHRHLMTNFRARIVIFISVLIAGTFACCASAHCVTENNETNSDFLVAIFIAFALITIIILYSLIYLKIHRQNAKREKSRGLLSVKHQIGSGRLQICDESTMGEASETVMVQLENDNEPKRRSSLQIFADNIRSFLNFKSPSSNKETIQRNQNHGNEACSPIKETESEVDTPKKTASVTDIDNEESTTKVVTVSDKVAKNRRKSRLKKINIKRQYRTATMLFVISIVFIISFLPTCYVTLGYKLIKDFQIKSSIVLSLSITYIIAFAVNPLIYALMSQRFRDDTHLLIRRIKNCFSNHY